MLPAPSSWKINPAGMLAAAAVLCGLGGAGVLAAREDPRQVAAAQIYGSLTPEQRAKAAFSFDDPDRTKERWFTPGPDRQGIRVRDLTPEQQEAVTKLLQASTSNTGFPKVDAITNKQNRRADAYWLTFFGEPKAGSPWAWRFEGHHFSVTVPFGAEGETRLGPLLLGSNPPVLFPEEHQAALAFHQSLSDEQKKSVELPVQGPMPGAADGVTIKELPEGQRKQAMALLETRLQVYDPETVASIRRYLRAAGGPDRLRVALYGEPTDPSGKYYWKVFEPGFLCYYDGRSGHIHSSTQGAREGK
jgi:hypothetical protein